MVTIEIGICSGTHGDIANKEQQKELQAHTPDLVMMQLVNEYMSNGVWNDTVCSIELLLTLRDRK